ncbi:hypothetical protein SAMN04488125_102269 [Methylorubrum salsuginis]|uniref:Flagellar biosynthesis protein, FliO n=1 Tax=Methylorubrum salsuginis TaxID=414703 RepID=A0A1I4A7F3_9HYPH|nr:hypothetical protein SAMN04488125_102269 [Methylorubrum salsuginis]
MDRTGLLTNDSDLLRAQPTAAIIARSHERAGQEQARTRPRRRKTRVLQAFFGSDGSVVVQFLVIFLVILVLMIGAVLLYRRFAGRGLSLTAGANGRGRQPRLGIVDIYELDRQRQLILLRRDNVEHLLLVGGPNDVVIERNIQRGAGARYAPEPDHAVDPGLEAAQETRRADKFLDSPAPPAFAMPEVVPPAMPGAEPPHPERTPPLDPGLFEPEVIAPASAPARTRPASPVSRLIRRTLPPLGGTQPEAAPAVPSPAPADPEPAVPPASEPVPETPPVIAGRGPRPVDPAVLSDMARQLQVALKRPSSAVTPPPGGAEAPPLPPAPDLRPDPLAAAMAAAQAEPPAPAPAPPPAKLATAPKPTADANPAPETKSEAAPKPAPAEPVPAAPPAPPKPAPVLPAPAKPAEAAPKPEARPADTKPASQATPPKSEAPKPEAPKPDAAKPEAASTSAQNPFSVEEIEAEFARLLGRPLDTKN